MVPANVERGQPGEEWLPGWAGERAEVVVQVAPPVAPFAAAAVTVDRRRAAQLKSRTPAEG